MSKQIKWSIDQSHTEINFKVKHLMISNVKGSFKTFDASIYTSGKDFTTADVDLWIDAASIDTRDTKRDEHLKSKEFFDVANHKQITFVSSTIGKPDEKGNHELWGELTMNGVTQNVMFNVEFGGIVKDPWGNEKAVLTLSGKIHRKDWGLVWNTTLEAGGVMVSDEVNMSCELELLNMGDKDLVMEIEKKTNKISL